MLKLLTLKKGVAQIVDTILRQVTVIFDQGLLDFLLSLFFEHFLPRDLVARLRAAVEAEGADMACAASLGRPHPVFGLWPLALKDELARAMREEGIRKVDAWTARYRLATVDFAPAETPAGPLDPFFNTNRLEDLDRAERFAAV